MEKKDIFKSIEKTKDKLVEVGSTVGETIIETGKQVKDSKAIEKVTKSAKTSADVLVKGAKTGAEKLTEGAKSGAEKIKNTVDEMTGKSIIVDGHNVLRFKGNKIRLLIPDEYNEVTERKMLDELGEIYGLNVKIAKAFILNTENSLNVISYFYPGKDESMDFEDKQARIDNIHENLVEHQGLIEVNNGKTARGYDYIYSIVKTVGSTEENIPNGVRYFLRLDIRHEEKVIEIYGSFEEQGTTGIRESMATCFAEIAGIYSLGGDNWNEDPYDPSFNRGICKNLAEKEGLDGLFPENPLSLAHAFLLATLNDELVIIKKEDESEEQIQSEEMSDEEKEKASQEFLKNLFVDECRRPRFKVDIESIDEKENEDKTTDKKESREKLDDKLRSVIDEYNAIYTLMSDKGTSLYIQRERSIDLIKNIENLVNSIANHPKQFDTELGEIGTMRQQFTDTCEYAKKELEAAQKSAIGAGAGLAGGAAVAALAPNVAMWVATTFGTASTGTAISALSGAAAQSAALAWLGGGAVAVGGGGMTAGSAFLALAGPVGWGIVGATLLTSVVLFANKRMKLDKQKKEEIEAVLNNIELLKEVDLKIKQILDKTETLRESVSAQYGRCLNAYGKDFMSLNDDAKLQLGTLVNETKALAALLEEGV